MRRSALFLERFDAAPASLALPGPETAREQSIRNEAYSAGFAAGRSAANERDALIAATARALSDEYADAPKRISEEAAGALRIVLERLFPTLSRQGFAVEAAAAFARVARETAAPSLQILTAPENVDALAAELRRSAADADITVAPDTALSGAQARACWSTGGIEIDLDRTASDCLAALERAALAIRNESEL